MSNFKPPVRGGTGATALLNRIASGSTGWTPMWGFAWRVQIDFSSGSVGATALAAATTQNINLDTAYPNLTFPKTSNGIAGVLRGFAMARVVTPVSGGSISAITLELGDNADPDALITSTSIFTGASAGWFSTPAAAEYTPRVETGFIPELELNSVGGNLSTIAAGRVDLLIGFVPLPSDNPISS